MNFFFTPPVATIANHHTSKQEKNSIDLTNDFLDDFSAEDLDELLTTTEMQYAKKAKTQSNENQDDRISDLQDQIGNNDDDPIGLHDDDLVEPLQNVNSFAERQAKRKLYVSKVNSFSYKGKGSSR